MKWVPSIIVSLMILSSAFMKLTTQPQLVELFSKTGLLPYIKVLGAAELLFVTLFLWTRSIRIGFLLLTAYFGGAMAVELSQHHFFMIPLVILILVWLAAWYRDNSLFIPLQKSRATGATA